MTRWSPEPRTGRGTKRGAPGLSLAHGRAQPTLGETVMGGKRGDAERGARARGWEGGVRPQPAPPQASRVPTLWPSMLDITLRHPILSSPRPLTPPRSSTRVAAQSPSPTLSSWAAPPSNCPHLSLHCANSGAGPLCRHLSVDLQRPGNHVAAFLLVRRTDLGCRLQPCSVPSLADFTPPSSPNTSSPTLSRS